MGLCGCMPSLVSPHLGKAGVSRRERELRSVVPSCPYSSNTPARSREPPGKSWALCMVARPTRGSRRRVPAGAGQSRTPLRRAADAAGEAQTHITASGPEICLHASGWLNSGFATIVSPDLTSKSSGVSSGLAVWSLLVSVCLSVCLACRFLLVDVSALFSSSSLRLGDGCCAVKLSSTSVDNSYLARWI